MRTGPATPQLKRVLTLWDLVFYGIVMTLPIAPVPLFGIAQDLSRGHFVTTLLVAMLPMVITAVSYGRMAALYPAAGSAYSYVGRGISPYLGFLAGWAIFLDFLMQPIINTIWIATALHARYLTRIPYLLLALLTVGVILLLNFLGVRTTARASEVLLAIITAVIGAFIVLAVRFLFRAEGWPGLFSLAPFYDSKNFDFHSIRLATSFSALTYVGFEGVTTLAEDARNARRNVWLATVLVVVFTGVFSGLQVYLGQRVWPDYRNFPNLETAFMDVSRRVGGPTLFHAMGAIIAVASFGAGLTGAFAAGRLLFGMGRDGVLPRKVFAHLSPKTQAPTFNFAIIGLLSVAGALVLSYEQAGELINFGAFLAYMAVNLAAFWQFTLRRRPEAIRRWLRDAVLPLIGVAFCAWVGWGLKPLAKMIGGAWLLGGLAYLAITTRGFRTAPAMIDFSEV